MARLPILRINRDPEKYARELRKPELLHLLKELDYQYHIKSKPRVSDAVYEQLKDVFRERFPKDKYLKEVGAKFNKDESVKLPVPMASLTKVKPGTQNLLNFLDKKKTYTLSDKLDGISLEIVYEGGRPVSAYTRHDGTHGKDVSRHIPVMRIPKRVSVRNRFVVRAEAIIKAKTFASKFDKESGGDFTAARNMVGGAINNVDSDVARFRSIDIVVFAVLDGAPASKPLKAQLAWAKLQKFTVVENVTKRGLTEEKLSEYHAQRIAKSPYEIDGIVVTESITPPKITARNPAHARAFKENSEQDMRDVVVKKIVWDENRTGKLIPTVYFTPVKVPGATMSKALGHSLFYIEHGRKKSDYKGQKKMPIAVGSTIRVVRSGKVIPYIVGVLKPARKAAVPDVPFERKGVHAVVKKASARVQAKEFAHFFNTIGITGFRLATIEKLVDAGYETLEDLMSLEVEDFESVQGLGTSKGVDFVRQMKDKRKAGFDFATIAEASNKMPGFSKSRLSTIYEAFPNILRRRANATLVADLQELQGFKKIAEEFVEALPALRMFIKEHKFKIVKPVKVKVTGAKVKGKLITFTGLRDAELQAWIEKNGGVVQNMKADTNLVLTKEGYSSSKIDKAEAKGIPVMTVDEFRSKYKV